MKAALCVHRRPAGELSGRQIDLLLAFGRQQAYIVDQLEAAARREDWEAVKEFAKALIHAADAAKDV
jgi:hypothetical protein